MSQLSQPEISSEVKFGAASIKSLNDTWIGLDEEEESI
jgi:hypothetical protein